MFLFHIYKVHEQLCKLYRFLVLRLDTLFFVDVISTPHDIKPVDSIACVKYNLPEFVAQRFERETEDERNAVIVVVRSSHLNGRSVWLRTDTIAMSSISKSPVPTHLKVHRRSKQEPVILQFCVTYVSNLHSIENRTFVARDSVVSWNDRGCGVQRSVLSSSFLYYPMWLTDPPFSGF